MGLHWISAADDPRLALYLDLKDRDIRRETGLFLAEGEHVVRRAFEASRPGAASHPGAGLIVRSVLVVESKVERVREMVAAAGQGVALAAAAGWSAGMVAILAAALISARRAGPVSSAAPALRGGRGFAPGRLALR